MTLSSRSNYIWSTAPVTALFHEGSNTALWVWPQMALNTIDWPLMAFYVNRKGSTLDSKSKIKGSSYPWAQCRLGAANAILLLLKLCSKPFSTFMDYMKRSVFPWSPCLSPLHIVRWGRGRWENRVAHSTSNSLNSFERPGWPTCKKFSVITF